MKAVCHISLSDSEDALVARQAKLQSWTTWSGPHQANSSRDQEGSHTPCPPTVLERAEQRFRVDRC